ncbi:MULTISPECIES: sugar transferase [unclassified Lentimonas]|uniref:sugar transferase n=1 Tax=unclassified Lentimonas TaxID=2630993 RepID=UPI00132BD220|nr:MULTISPECIES: sugar transferase [unclassified Lentimonas]CAA6696203.1 Unannotated [Lentimonas sp. CC10]CAA6697534.1 Unannotated [Lentimonas sp. CC19]CAA7071252.1 Unannotated [Lentimonas sp. CC11]
MDSILTSQSLTLPQEKRESATRSTLMLLFAGDVLVILLSACLAFFLKFRLFTEVERSLQSYQVHILIGSAVMAAILYLKGTYRIDQITRFRYNAVSMLTCACYWAGIYISVSLILKISPDISRLCTLYNALIAGGGLMLWRYLFCRHFVKRTLLQSVRRKTLLIGWNERAQELLTRSEASDSHENFCAFRLQSVILLDPNMPDDLPNHVYRGHGLAALEKQLERGQYDTVLLTKSDIPADELLQIQEICGREMVDFMLMPDFVQTLTSCLSVESFNGMPLLTQTKRELSKTSSRIYKRGLDIMGALFGLALFAPVIAYFCWRVYRESPGPVFYKQVRMGQHGKPFEIIKIRSMRLDAEKETGAQWCVENDTRRLSIGAFMRKYNIDELLQFWNVLRGEMSLVGPRPERPELIKDFKHQVSYYNVRHLVKPGVTGWAQVNGWRGDTCLNSRIACDLEYIERWNFWWDIYICLKTLRANQNAY